MPKEIIAILILVFAALPGVSGDKIYRTLIGVNWREREWQSILRLTGFSIAGLMLYVLVADLCRWPPPIYLFPSSYADGTVTPYTMHQVVLPYAGQFVGAAIVGAFMALVMRLLGRWVSAYPAAWDDFVRRCIPHHFAVVALTNKEAFFGIIRYLDISVKQTERDIVLQEPAIYDEQKKNYVALPYQYLFLPASLVSSIAVVHDPNIDGTRITTVGETIFEKEKPDEQK